MEQFEQVKERDRAERGQFVMPFYLVCDVSWSMERDIGNLNTALRNLKSSISLAPVVNDVARVSLITFSDTARIVMPMGQVSESEFPQLTLEGGTNYGAAFTLLADAISADCTALDASGYRIYRSCVFFLTDGLPQDGTWLQTFNATLTYDPRNGTGMKAYPVFVPFGFREADAAVLSQLAYPKERGRWYLAENVTAEAALEGIREIIMKTVMTASMTAARGQTGAIQPALPAQGSGIASGASNRIDDFIN